MCDGNCNGCTPSAHPSYFEGDSPKVASSSDPFKPVAPPSSSEFDHIGAMLQDLLDDCHVNMNHLEDRLCLVVSCDPSTAEAFDHPPTASAMGRRLTNMCEALSMLNFRIKDLENRVVV